MSLESASIKVEKEPVLEPDGHVFKDSDLASTIQVLCAHSKRLPAHMSGPWNINLLSSRSTLCQIGVLRQFHGLNLVNQ